MALKGGLHPTFVPGAGFLAVDEHEGIGARCRNAGTAPNERGAAAGHLSTNQKMYCNATFGV
jgi:hypothetical protein